MDKYLRKLGVKVVKTVAQAALGVIGSTALLSEVNWQVVLSTALLSGIVCVLMNLADLKEEE
ncbi:holin [Streptococcus ovis]|uniref:holin n=1 Tax=Streptococcus ovis TaxID=82806 RepID=UPI00035E0F22|nr:holin [Streptococcus ovis]